MTTAVPFWGIDPGQVQLALLAVARLSGMLLLTPPFNSPAVPPQVRMPMALALALPVWSVLAGQAPALAEDVLTLAGLASRELLVGLTIGFVGRLAVAAATFAAEVVGVQIGFGFASTLDPALGAHTTVLTRLYEWSVLGLLLALDAHHLILGTAIESFRVVPMGAAVLGVGGAAAVVSLGGRVFALGLELVAPIMGILFVTNLVLVLASRAVPQVNLLVVGFSFTVLVGLLVLVVNTDLMGAVIAREMQNVGTALTSILRSVADGR
jgi:flagellar biosynthetic protein FliR